MAQGRKKLEVWLQDDIGSKLDRIAKANGLYSRAATVRLLIVQAPDPNPVIEKVPHA